MNMFAKVCILVVCIASALSEKPIPGRFFSRPIFQRQEAAPYQPSGWKPSGERLILPQRQQAQVPHAVYGPPSSPPQQPGNEYGPPTEQPTNEYLPPEQPQEAVDPSNTYGPPGEGIPQEPGNAYGPPEEPASGYGPPDNQGYSYPPPQPQPDPSNEYGPPQQPGNEYGAPQQPTNEYGVPQQPDNTYGAPQDNGQLPVDQGASERLRQQQFVQQLPAFQPSRFRKPQRQRLQQSRRPSGQSQKLQQLPQRLQKQEFQQRKPQQQRLPLRAPNNQFAQKQQLYQAPAPTQTPEDVEPNIAIATSFSGKYYVIEPHGRLQEVSYTTKNGKLINGNIRNGIRFEEVQNTDAPIYQINEFHELVRIN